jgi:hypothetical protein
MLDINFSGQEIVPELLKVFAEQRAKLGDPSSLRKHCCPKKLPVLVPSFIVFSIVVIDL